MTRFMRYVRKEESGCWIWTGAQDRKGYGRFSVSDMEKVWTHRWIYQQMRGPIPDGFVIDHLCRNPSCVNPDHLEPVPQRINVLRGNRAHPARLADAEFRAMIELLWDDD